MPTASDKPTTKTWYVRVFLDENEHRTHARARLETRQATAATIEGVGLARRHPQDRDIAEIGDELAAARALEDLAHHLLASAGSDLQDAEQRGLLTLQPTHPQDVERGESLVVGIADASHDRGALAWATRYARDTHRGLDLVHVIEDGDLPPGATITAEHSPGREMLADLKHQLEKTSPELNTRTILSVGGAVSGLLARARGQHLLVVGRRGAGTFAQLILGSVAVAVVARAPLPTVVVPEDWDPEAHAREPIVLAVDPAGTTPGLLEFAFAEAERRGCPLVVSHGWEWPPFITAEPLAGPRSVEEWVQRHRVMIESALAPSQAAHPTVAVEIRQRHGHPATVILADVAHAQLVVLGRRERRILLASGRVARRVLHYAQVPVAVVPDSWHPGT